MKHIYIFALALCGAQVAAAQDNPNVACLPNDELSARFQASDTAGLPNYTESGGARVQRQYPNTVLIGHAKYINWDNNTPLAICQYSNHVGIVANFVLTGPTADVDGACDDGSCVNNAYWRREWTETSAEADRPGQEQIYVCMQDLEGGPAIPSMGCRFNRPTN